MKRPAFFLDRDGNINLDRVYINDPRLVELIPGSGEAIARAQAAGYLIVVVTNQSGVGRGIIRPEVLEDIHVRLNELLAEKGASIDLYKSCLHSPAELCKCRKPSPKMVLEAAAELNIDLSRSIFVGDKLSDVATGQAAKCGSSILVRTGKGSAEEKLLEIAAIKIRPDYVADDLEDAIDWAMKI